MATGSDAPIEPLQVIVETKPTGCLLGRTLNGVSDELVGLAAGDPVGVGVLEAVELVGVGVVDSAEGDHDVEGELCDAVPALDPHAVASSSSNASAAARFMRT